MDRRTVALETHITVVWLSSSETVPEGTVLSASRTQKLKHTHVAGNGKKTETAWTLRHHQAHKKRMVVGRT